MRNLFLFTLLFLLTNLVSAQTTYTTAQVGEWSNPNTWDGNGVPPEPIPAGDIVNITNTVITDFTAAITNNGTINVSGFGMLEMRGSTVLTNNGELNGNSSAFAVVWARTGTTVINNGTITVQEDAGNNPAFRLFGGDLTNNGTLDFINVLFTVSSENSLFTNAAGALLKLGTDTQFNIFSFTSNNTVVSNAGTIDAYGSIFFNEGTQENLPTGVINLNGNPFGQLTIGNILNNSGTINVNSAVNTQRTVDLFSDAVLNSANGTINITSGYFRGNGTMILPTMTNNAIFIPFAVDGTSDGIFNLTGNYDGAGEIRIFPRDPSIGTTGQLAATGAVDISQQSLFALFAQGLSDPAVGTTFPIITAGGGVNGTFASELLPPISDPNKEWRVQYGPDFVNLVVAAVGASQDGDNDGVEDSMDNCPTIANPGQADLDNDGLGDVCDSDRDGDGVNNNNDAFPDDPTETSDNDSDGIGDNADTDDDNDGQSDTDELACGSDPLDAASLSPDNDGDNIPDCVDQDDDNDGVLDANDNCQFAANPGQEDLDYDGIGDACDPDVCINTAVDGLKDYVNGMSISSGMKRAINTRLDKAVYRFCRAYPTSAVVSTLNSVIDYVDYQNNNGAIASADADFINGQVNLLIDALNNGIVVCCMPRPAPPTGPGYVNAEYQLQASPNPFREQVAIRFYLPDAGPATLEVFNLNGQRVAALHSGYLDAGYQDYSWNGAADGGSQMSSGIYLVRLQTEEGTLTQKVSLVR